MKKMSILLSLVTIMFCSCNSQEKEDVIIGSWKVIQFDANTTLAPAMIEGAKAEAITRIYSFQNDSTFNMKSKLRPDGELGKWEIDLEKKIIKMTYRPGAKQTKETYTLDILNGESMKWTQDLKEHGSVSMTLKKE